MDPATAPPPEALRDPLGPDLPPGVHRLRSRSATAALLPGLARAGWSTRVVDLAGSVDKAALLGTVGQALGFPAWVGRNWDAMDDALRDLSWWPAGARGRVIVIRGAGRASTATTRDREVLRAVLETAAARWAPTPTPLVVLLRR
jgi:hypothetical protein